MGQCQPCLGQSRTNRTDVLDLRATTDISSPGATPNARLRRKKKEICMSSLIQEVQEYGEGGDAGDEDLRAIQKLYSAEINFDNFDVVKVIGRGSYAKVYLIKKWLVESENPEYYALKVLKKKALYDKNLLHHTL